ncbi:Mitogen-activated protein kinase kinase kinase 17 [Camellia lanceoleosa]|uniref:Mitogen-activated protein kinase kinase kinase 17 n=1 Tax=Camellia lanceoleosa TaxID=1840588 RepID=A0ACC0FYC4_9ERIC|nr:Mitogen-activated protein kinase kinase kinase 17 [Camellia lanceoleosa]
MMWRRGKILGKGGSAIVYLAAVVSPPRSNELLPSLMAAKSAPVNNSQLLSIERELFSQFEGCPHILRCFGDDVTIEDGEQWYNILLEYAAGGSLADRIQSYGRGLPETEVRRYTKSVLLGLSYIHNKGYVHCDIKPQNILLVDDLSMDLNEKMNRVQERTAKIADLGLVKKAGERLTEKGRKLGIRGTALYIAPESIRHEDYEPEADIWALGCTILELLTGKEPWKCDRNTEIVTILFKIASTQEIPEIPSGFSEEAEDFLKKCLVRDPKSRWTADMLLGHPFVSAADGVFTGSIREERNRVVHPKTA